MDTKKITHEGYKVHKWDSLSHSFDTISKARYETNKQGGNGKLQT